MSLREWISMVLYLACGYAWGLGYGYKQARIEYRGAIDQACEDYREAARIITKLRNRLQARRILEMKTAANAAEKAK